MNYCAKCPAGLLALLLFFLGGWREGGVDGDDDDDDDGGCGDLVPERLDAGAVHLGAVQRQPPARGLLEQLQRAVSAEPRTSYTARRRGRGSLFVWRSGGRPRSRSASIALTLQKAHADFFWGGEGVCGGNIPRSFHSIFQHFRQLF